MRLVAINIDSMCAGQLAGVSIKRAPSSESAQCKHLLFADKQQFDGLRRPLLLPIARCPLPAARCLTRLARSLNN